MEAALEHTDRLSTCYEEGGAVVDAVSPVELAIERGTALSDEAMAELFTRCHHEAGVPPVRPTDRASATAAYGHALAVRECLIELGYEPTQPPSLETFIDGYRGSTGVVWTPLDGLDRIPPDEFRALKGLCPPWTGE